MQRVFREHVCLQLQSVFELHLGGDEDAVCEAALDLELHARLHIDGESPVEDGLIGGLHALRADHEGGRACELGHEPFDLGVLGLALAERTRAQLDARGDQRIADHVALHLHDVADDRCAATEAAQTRAADIDLQTAEREDAPVHVAHRALELRLGVSCFPRNIRRMDAAVCRDETTDLDLVAGLQVVDGGVADTAHVDLGEIVDDDRLTQHRQRVRIGLLADRSFQFFCVSHGGRGAAAAVFAAVLVHLLAFAYLVRRLGRAVANLGGAAGFYSYTVYYFAP